MAIDKTQLQKNITPGEKAKVDVTRWLIPDSLHHNLDVVFVGINPGLSSQNPGHFFNGHCNRFWDSLNESGISCIYHL